MTEWKEGDFARHAHWGTGKIVHRDASQVQVYFKIPDTGPVERVRSFPADTDRLQRIPASPDPELDALPPWNGTAFEGARLKFTLPEAEVFFRHLFPRGLQDPAFLQSEILYKRAAHKRFSEGFAPHVARWIDAGDARAIAEGLNAVYGDPKEKDGSRSRLNLLYQQIDEPAFFDALRHGGEATVGYAKAAMAFVGAPSAATFQGYAEALTALPPTKSGKQLDSWSISTWLPFIADPGNHIIVKPTLVREMASAMAFHLPYTSDLTWRTYSKCVEMARLLGHLLRSSDLNLTGEVPDMIQVQSFMWVVERYKPSDA